MTKTATAPTLEAGRSQPYTSGPWDYCPCGCGFVGGGDDEVCRVTSGKWGDWGRDFKTGEVTLAHHWGTVPPERAMANGRLIAAAPDLYETLYALLLELGEGGLPSPDTVINAGRALRKARGDA